MELAGFKTAFSLGLVERKVSNLVMLSVIDFHQAFHDSDAPWVQAIRKAGVGARLNASWQSDFDIAQIQDADLAPVAKALSKLSFLGKEKGVSTAAEAPAWIQNIRTRFQQLKEAEEAATKAAAQKEEAKCEGDGSGSAQKSEDFEAPDPDPSAAAAPGKFAGKQQTLRAPHVWSAGDIAVISCRKNKEKYDKKEAVVVAALQNLLKVYLLSDPTKSVFKMSSANFTFRRRTDTPASSSAAASAPENAEESEGERTRKSKAMAAMMFGENALEEDGDDDDDIEV